MPDVSSPHQYLVFRLGRVYLPPSCHSVHSQCQCRVHLLSPTETQIDSCLTSPSPSLVSVSLGSRPFHPPWPPVCSPASIVKASDDDVMRKHCLEESGRVWKSLELSHIIDITKVCLTHYGCCDLILDEHTSNTRLQL